MRAVLRVLLRAGLPLLVLLLGAGVSLYLLRSVPKAERQPRPRLAQLVEVTPVALGRFPAVVEAMGTVVPAREIALHPEVSGRVVTMGDGLQPGGLFAAGETLLEVDDANYRLAVEQRRADLVRAEADLNVEQGNQQIAKSEFALLGEVVREQDQALVLRKPQLESSRAAVAQARAALEQARLDLARTRLVAPFDGMVLSRSVERGALVGPSNSVATIVGTGAYWIEVAVPVSELKWIAIPRAHGEVGSEARITEPAAWGRGVERQGRVIRLLGDLESQGRMARLLVEVADPLALAPEHAGLPMLLIDSFVRVEILGAPLEGVAALDRRLLREGDQVWVLDEASSLEVRAVDVVYRGRDRVLIGVGLNQGDRVVSTDLSAPVPGMPLRTAEDAGR